MSELASSSYGNASLSGFEYAERIRKRPESMLGSNGLAGAQHCFAEINGNSLDEVSSGHCDRIEVSRYSDGSLSVRDFGRGVPMGWNEKMKMYNWHIVFNELYMGGKTDDDEKQLKLQEITDWSTITVEELTRRINYLFSVGLNGIGATATQYSSEWFIVKSYRDGICTEMHFQGGYPIINGEKTEVDKSFDWSTFQEVTYPTEEPNGTFINWKPDDTVFSDTDISFKYLCSICKDIAGVAGVTYVLYDEESDTTVTYEKSTIKQLLEARLSGLEDGDNKIFEMRELHHGKIVKGGKNIIWVATADIAFTFVKDNAPVVLNHNLVKVRGGAHQLGIENALSKFFKSVMGNFGLTVKESDYDNKFACIVATKSSTTSNKGQIKEGIDDGFIANMIETTLVNKLHEEYAKGNATIRDCVNEVKEEIELRIALAEQMKLTKQVNKSAKKKISDKFASCEMYSKNKPEKAELWIVEGDSAKGAIMKARDDVTQAVYPLRGKFLNCAKASLEAILVNKEITEIFALLGCGMDIKGVSICDKKDLRFHKIIFATDADEDGFQIRVLLFLVFYILAPELLEPIGVDENGEPISYVYIAETPRFRIEFANGEVAYANTNEIRDKIISEKGIAVKGMTRYKGLGETSAEVLAETTVAVGTRSLVPVVMDYENESLRILIDTLFGKDINHDRKALLAELLGGDVSSMMDDLEMRMSTIDNSDLDTGLEYQTLDL